MQTTVHLTFDGQCEDAFRYYEKHLGGKIEMIMRVDDSPIADQFPADRQKKIMHARVKVGDVQIMGADAPPDRYQKPQGFSVSLSVDAPAEAERLFAALADNGNVTMPMQQTFFASKFGMTFDRFGIPWLVICQSAA